MDTLGFRATCIARTGLPALLALFVLAAPAAASAQSAPGEGIPTRILIRVLAHDAKLIGTGVGGARVGVRDAHTGELLAQGEHQGGTGDTGRIMREPQQRGATIYDTEGAAAFVATLELEEPTVVEIFAEGPLDTPQSMQSARKTMLLVPGFDFVGEGVVLELYGFRVTLETPATVHPGEAIPVRATVRMMCGCPTEPGGLWNADDYTIFARLHRDGEVIAETPMEFTGETSNYAGSFTAPEGDGAVEVEVIAVDPGKANAGRAHAEISVGRH